MKTKALLIHALIYTTCFDIENKTRKVDKVLKQIRRGLSKIEKSDKPLYSEVISGVHKHWKAARAEVIPKGERLEVKMDELLLTLYNGVPKEYQNIFYTDRSFTAMANSFDSCLSSKVDALHYTIDGRALGEAFLKEIGITKDSKLSRLKYTIEQNLIIEGK